jgi:carbamoyltransferase
MPEAKASWILGLGGSDHEFSAALAKGCDIRVAIEQERLTRRKHGMSYWYEDPVKKSIDYCLAAEGIQIDDVELVVAADTLPARVRSDLANIPHRLFSHHLCHAASAYLMLPPGAKAGIIVADGYGSIRDRPGNTPERDLRETISLFAFGPDGFKALGGTLGEAYREQDDFPIGVTNSLGMLYELVTALLGYHPMDSGKTMGLASFGIPRFAVDLERFISSGNDPSDCFRCALDDRSMTTAIEMILYAGENGFQTRADLAASVQHVVNSTMLKCSEFFADQSIEFLCIAGGVGLNTVSNSFLVNRSSLNVPITIAPHCGDSGLALGAIWLERQERLDRSPPDLRFRGGPIAPGISRPGRHYSAGEKSASVQQFYPRLALDVSISTAKDLARIIASGSIIGLLSGGSEIGPRALGGRSILADPRRVSVRERINRQIKQREPFRPFAPIVLRSRYDAYFHDDRHADPYMLKVAKVRDRCRVEAPAVVHIDGTARVQVIDDSMGSFLTDILLYFEELTGVGIILNTSFNRRGEPIVESPLDAIDAFLGMGLDGLYLDGDFYWPAIPSS